MELVPSRGLTFGYSATVSRELTGSGSNQYYLPVEPSDGTFVDFVCIKDVPNVGNIEGEYSEHRCLDAAEKYIEQFPTGFLMGEETTIKLAFAKAIYGTLQAYVIAQTQLCFRVEYALTATETNCSKHVRNGYIKKISDEVKTDGTEMDATFTIIWSTLPRFTAGT